MLSQQYIEEELTRFLIVNGVKGIDAEMVARVLRKLADDHVAVEWKVDEIVDRYRKSAR